MDFISGYVSDTLAAAGNQTIRRYRRAGVIRQGLVFLQCFTGGSYDRVFAFSDEIDSTYSDGSESRAGDLCSGWVIHSLRVSVVKKCSPAGAEKNGFTPVYFGGKAETTVTGAKYTFSDPVRVTAEKGDYICLAVAFSGRAVPYFKESITLSYVRRGARWVRSAEVPLPLFTGIKRDVPCRIGFIGDSITEGIGSHFNGYDHYAAAAAGKLGETYAFWNMGMGFARASDAAGDRLWLGRAKQNDIVCVCFGVNDILQGHSAEQIKADLAKIVDSLRSAGVKVLLQTVPPFDYDERNTAVWREVNGYIKSTLGQKADALFDTSAVLSADGIDTPRAKYGPHPDSEGHRLWGERLADTLAEMLSGGNA